MEKTRLPPKLGTVGVLFGMLLLSGCPAPRVLPRPAKVSLHEALEHLYAGGRFARLAERVAQDSVAAEHEAPDLLGLLLAAQGHPTEGLALIEKAASAGPGTTEATELCLALDMALISFYQLGDGEATVRALDKLDPAVPGCRGDRVHKTVAALRARASAAGPRLFQVEGPTGEQRLPLDPIAANAGYLVARLSFDREHSGQFLLTTGDADMFLDVALSKELHLKEQSDRPMPARDVPGTTRIAGHFADFPTATLQKAQLGLFTLRDVPVLISDFSTLRDLFKRSISRSVELVGVLPLQRLLRTGYARLLHRATEMRLATSSATGPCRLQHPFVVPLYQLAGGLFTDASLAGGPPLLFRLDLGQRRTLVRPSVLRYAPDQGRSLSRQGGESDVARPTLTEAEVRERIVQAVLRMGRAELLLHQIPLQPAEPAAFHQPEEHGSIGTDVPGEFDFMFEPGDGHMYLSPPDRVNCAN